MLFGRAMSQAIQATRSAGASDGADALTAANSKPAPAAAAQDRAAFSAQRTSQGRRRWARTAPRCPVLSEPRRGGASIQSTAATAGSHRRRVIRLAQNQAPMAAIGSARTYTSTMLNDGAQKVSDPS